MNIRYDFSFPEDEFLLRVLGDYTSRLLFWKIFLFSLIGGLCIVAGFANYAHATEVFIVLGGYYLLAVVWWGTRSFLKKGPGARRLLKVMKCISSFGVPGTEEINDEEMITNSENGCITKLRWNQVSSSFEGTDYFYFVCGKVLVGYLNKKDMTLGQIQELKAWLTDHSKWGKGKPSR